MAHGVQADERRRVMHLHIQTATRVYAWWMCRWIFQTLRPVTVTFCTSVVFSWRKKINLHHRCYHQFRRLSEGHSYWTVFLFCGVPWAYCFTSLILFVLFVFLRTYLFKPSAYVFLPREMSLKPRKLSYTAKMTARCALYMGALKIFQSAWIRPRLLFPKFLMGFCFERSYECAYKIGSS